jgi:hypothetical protein
MAITIGQTPYNFTPSNNPIIFSASTSLVGNQDLQLIFDIETKRNVGDSWDLITTQKKYVNNITSGSSIDISSIISSYCDSDLDYKSLFFVNNPNKRIYFRVGVTEQYYDSGTTQYVETTPATYSDAYISFYNRINGIEWINWGILDNSLGKDIVGGILDNNYLLKTVDGNNNHLSPIILDEYEVGWNDLGVISFAQEIPLISLTGQTPIGRIVLEAYDINNTQLTKIVRINNLYNGVQLEGDERFVSIFNSPAQINNINNIWRDYSSTATQGGIFGGTPLPSNTDYYLLYIEYREPDLANPGQFVHKVNSKKFKYKIKDYCYEYKRLMWLNEFSGWDAFNFVYNKREQINIQKNNYNQVLENNYSYKNYRGTNNYLNTWNKTTTVNTDWITEPQAKLIESLFKSKEVYVQEGNEFVPVIINAETINMWNNIDDLFLYELSFSYAVNEFIK